MASQSTRDHEEIQRWAEERGACPAVVSRTGGMLRFEFDRPPELADVSWDDFFRVFDERGLELVYDDQPESRFHKLAYPEGKEAGKAARKPRANIAARQPTARRTAPGRSRTGGGSRTAAARQSGGSESGRTTTRSSKSKKPAGKTTKKSASQRPSPSRRAA
jgi:hypothetical protein